MEQTLDLQILQNNGLRCCKRYYIRDRVRIDRLHGESKILGLEQHKILE